MDLSIAKLINPFPWNVHSTLPSECFVWCFVDCIVGSNVAGEPLQDEGQPVDDVEDEEQKGKRFQEELVNTEIENYFKVTLIDTVN